ncbi:MAG: hypothetical protein RR500_03530 [Bacilli bacterium]
MKNLFDSMEEKDKKMILISLIIIIICIVGTTITRKFTKPKRNPEAVAGILVGGYYEDEVYTKYKNHEDLEKYSKVGITYSLYEMIKMYDTDAEIILKDLGCIYKKATVKIIPISPFEKKDYKYEVNMTCDK